MSKNMRMRSDTTILPVNSELWKRTYTTRVPPVGGTYHDYTTVTTDVIDSILPGKTEEMKSMTDWVASDYRNRIKRGEIISSPCSSVITKVEDPLVFVNKESSYWKYAQSMYPDPGDIPLVRLGYKYFGTQPASVFLGRPLTTSYSLALPNCNVNQMIDLAVTDAHARVDTSDAAALVTAGELNETIEFIYDTSKRLLKIYKAIRKLDVSAMRKQISGSELAKRYLEYRYAIRPLVSEIDTYVKALTSTSKSTRQTYRSFVPFSKTTYGSEYLAYTDGTFGKVYAREKVSRTVMVRAGVLCAVDKSKLDRWGFSKPIDALWDLIPFSFIADWFFNIGSTIASFTPELGLEQLTSWYTTTDTVSQVKEITRVSLNPNPHVNRIGYCWNFDISNGYIKRETKTYQRVINPKLSILPTFRLRLDNLKVLDIALIIRSMCIK